MKPWSVVWLCIMLLNSGSGDYTLADNPASKNVFTSDFQMSPIVGPKPKSMVFENTTLRLHEWGVKYASHDKMLDEIIDIYNDVTFGKGYKERCTGDSREDSKHSSDGRVVITVSIDFTKVSNAYIPSGFETKFEEYSLNVNKNGQVHIQADYYPGVVRALDTLSQLIAHDDDQDRLFKIDYAPITIRDIPDFAYRGIMVDTAREYFFPDVLKMIIDGFMLGRNNVFHWHFAEDDSIPMFSESYPDLVNYTAFRQNEIYTPKDVREIVQYAKIRGVKVVPEMEGPSHLHILGFYPEFQGMVGWFSNYTSTESYHGGPPYAPINPANEKTYEFLGKYLKDLDKVFDSDYWHLGGDEVSIGCVSGLNGTTEFLQKNGIKLNDLQDYYIKRERGILSNLSSSRKAGYWYRGENQKYGNGDILQYWGGSGGLSGSMERYPNNLFVYSPMDTYYLDWGYVNQYAGGSWCGGLHTWRDIWNMDPLTQVNANNRHQFLGGELCAWGEMNNEYNLPTKLFPRGAAMSFRLWNPSANMTFASVVEMMIKHQYRLKNYEIPHTRVTMRYCEVHTHHWFGA